MDLLLLIKDLLANMDLMKMFLFVFVATCVIFREPKASIRVLRKVLIGYVILVMIIR